MTRKRTPDELTLGKIRRLFFGSKTVDKQTGWKITHALDSNLLGVECELSFGQRVDRVSLKTLRKVVKTLGKIRAILEDRPYEKPVLYYIDVGPEDMC